MIGFILAEGMGSRLYPLTLRKANQISIERGIPPRCFNINVRPKPLAPITNRPMIYSSLLMMRSLGVDKTFVTTGVWNDIYMKHFEQLGVDAYLVKNRRLGYFEKIVKIVMEEVRKGYKGTVVVLSGDIVSNIDPRPALAVHERQKATATIVSTPITDDVRTCSPIVIEDPLQKSGLIADYRHKLSRQDALKLSRYRNSSVYLFDTSFFEMVAGMADEDDLDFSEDIFPWLVKNRSAKFMGYASDALWADVGELDYYLNIQRAALDQRLHFPYTEEFYPQSRIYAAGRYRVLGPSIISEGCDIGRGSVIGPYAVIGEGWGIGSNSKIIRSVFWPVDIGPSGYPGCFTVESGVTVADCAVGSGRIDRDAREEVIVSNGSETFRRQLNISGGH
ncbi:MAG: NDP-sugar synthase [Candidatus Saganbacteria bacterium]|nr:NDP-sugar synthase [Candidatus Saganbacteria bacterium]